MEENPVVGDLAIDNAPTLAAPGTLLSRDPRKASLRPKADQPRNGYQKSSSAMWWYITFLALSSQNKLSPIPWRYSLGSTGRFGGGNDPSGTPQGRYEFARR